MVALAALSEKNKLTILGSKIVLCNPETSTLKALPLNLIWPSNSTVFQPNSTLVISSDSTSGFTVYEPSALDDPTGLFNKPGLKPSDHVT